MCAQTHLKSVYEDDYRKQTELQKNKIIKVQEQAALIKNAAKQ